ncbi:MAG TPA: bifunctional alpha,alpha-trehalose-phosphate synthase (UDP-forming)/trehalose-phosphatase [Polyangiaceae bacterium]|nr:bifunctional alpha,alpha-trehalose-phosphate synthase (UDP-forming)/trehalose-phosphatase [Polyangiaceae bacterium]
MSRLLIVSNRLPVSVRAEQGALQVVPSAGGLATAMRGPHERLDALWVGWPGDVGKASEAERKAIDGRLRAMRTGPIYLSSSEVAHFYDGFSNGVLWPLLHYLLDKVRLDAQRDWEVYRAVNQRFADRVVEHYAEGDLVWVHDYQLTLVPAMVRQQLPGARIGFFLHVPFPSDDVFRILPWREEILRGLLGADLIGFHTESYRRNFALACSSVLGVEPGVDALWLGGRRARRGVHAIGNDFASFDGPARDPAVLAEAAALRPQAPGARLVLGVDRLDYTKGILRRLLAVERLLEREPSLRGRVRFLQIAVPSREKVEAYAELRRSVNEAVGRINAHYGTPSEAPLHLLYRSLPAAQLVALYRAADAMLVTPLRDGMNLVAKEYVAARPDERGVLVLSEFAGAAAELREALLVNPFDLGAVAAAVKRALDMPAHEQAARMRALRAQVSTHDVHQWAEGFLADLTAGGGAAAGERSPPVEAGRQALARLREAFRRARRAPRRLLLLDYDGTLVPRPALPELAMPDAPLLALLERLARTPSTEVHVVSERPRESLERWLGELPLHLHAEHGFWSRPAGAAAWRANRLASDAWKDRLRPAFAALSRRTPGSFVEETFASIALHWPGAEATVAAVRIRELRERLGALVPADEVELVEGIKVLLVRLRGVNKALVAAAALADRPAGTFVAAAGDGVTDDDMFRAAPPEALTIRVGGWPSATAAYQVDSHAELRALLGELVPDPEDPPDA